MSYPDEHQHPTQTDADNFEALFGHKPVEVNATGGKQSRLERRFDLISPCAVQRLAHVLWYGAQRYGDDNWKAISSQDHVNHALDHLFAWLGQETDEDHLGHAFTRIMMAIDIAENGMIVDVTDEPEDVLEEGPLYSPVQIRRALDVPGGLNQMTIDRILELLNADTRR